MAEQHVVRIEWTPVTEVDGVWSADTTSSEVLDGVTNAQVDTRLGKSADSFSLKLFDVKGGVENYYFDRVNQGDLVNVYSSVDNGVTEVLEINGIVGQVTKRVNPDNKTLTITGLNQLESLLGLITPVSGGVGVARSSDAWIRVILREVNTQNGYGNYSGSISSLGEPTGVTIIRSDRYIKGGLLSEWTDAGNHVSTKTNPNNFVKGEQIAFEVIETLSSEEYAGSLHMFYINTDKEFRWLPLNATLTGAFSDNHQSTSVDHQKYDSYNYVVIKAGKNLFDNANIINFKYDLLAAVRDGIKAKVEYFDGINKTVRAEMRTKMKNEVLFAESTFPFPSGYPFVTPSNWSTGAGSISTANDSALNSAFIDEVLFRADTEAQKILELRANADIKQKRTIPDGEDIQNSFLLGGYYSDTPLTGKNLRINRHTKMYSIKKGWELNLGLEEDLDKITS